MSKQSNFNYMGIVTFQVTITFGLGFYEIFVGHFEFCCVIFIIPD